MNTQRVASAQISYNLPRRQADVTLELPASLEPGEPGTPGSINDLANVITTLSQRMELDLELDYTQLLQPIDFSITFPYEDYIMALDEAGCQDQECMCEQSMFWATIDGANCYTTSVMYWYHPDYLGNMEFVSNRHGKPHQFYWYSPWGEPLVQQHLSIGNFNTRYFFNSKELDEETGLYYYGARYYNPEFSQWFSVDALANEFPAWNPYNFTVNNPINLLDPDGNAPGDPQPYLKFGMTIGTQGLRFFSSLDLNVPFGNFSAGYGFSATYHSNFYSTNKSGFEFRNSLQLNFNDGSHNVSIGTNMWGGTGQMKEFSQRTGMCSYSYKGFGFSYENDGVPFGSIGLGDNNDSYRTAAASIFGGGVSLNMNLLTGRRDASSFAAEYDLPGGKMGIPEGLGQFGEFYSHGFVVESGNKYRFGGLTLNYNGFSIGIDSDRYVRHAFQNVFAHDIIKDQRMFPVLSGGMNPVINYTPLKLNYSNFTTWGL